MSPTRKLGSKGSTLSKSNLDMMKNSSHRDEYPAMQSNGPLPQVTSHFIKSFLEKHQFCQHYIQLLDARRVHFVPNWKVGFTPLNYGQHDGDIPQTCKWE